METKTSFNCDFRFLRPANCSLHSFEESSSRGRNFSRHVQQTVCCARSTKSQFKYGLFRCCMGETISAATWNWFSRVHRKFRCAWANNITKPCIWKIITNHWYIHASSFQYNLTSNINNVQCIFNRITLCRRNA